MNEETLTSEERNAILRQVIAQPAPKEVSTTPKKSSVITEGQSDLSQLSFGELLEQTLAVRGEMDKEDAEGSKRIDEARGQAISHSRFDILKDWKL